MENSIIYTVFWLAVLAVSLFALLKSADYFVETAEKLGLKFNIPSFIVGATVVAFGTSLPELAVGIISVLQNEPDIVTGTVVGSNISNILFIIGVGIAISSGFKINFTQQKVEFLILIATTFICSYFLYDKVFTTTEAIIGLLMLIGYLVYVIKFSKSADDDNNTENTNFTALRYILFLLSIGGIWLGAKFTTDAIVNVSNKLHLGSDVISQTVVALGTSLPELAVTVAAARKMRFGIVLGNVIGSNIFNLLAVLSIPAIIGNLSKHFYLVYDNSFNQFSIPIMLVATILLVLLALLKSTPRFVGYLFILLYVFFMVGSFLKINLLHLF